MLYIVQEHVYLLAKFAWSLDMALHLQSTGQLKGFNVNRCHYVACNRSKMEHLDEAASSRELI